MVFSISLIFKWKLGKDMFKRRSSSTAATMFSELGWKRPVQCVRSSPVSPYPPTHPAIPSLSLSLHIFVLLLEEFILLTTSLCWVSRLFVGIEEEGRSSGRRLIKAKNEMEQTVDRLGGSD
jgi:hypothetical protein